LFSFLYINNGDKDSEKPQNKQIKMPTEEKLENKLVPLFCNVRNK